MERRDFLKSAGMVGAASLLQPSWAWPSAYQDAPRYFGLHPFVAAHPEAVFVKRTQVAENLNGAAKMQEGKSLARELFTLQDTPGFSLTGKVAIKPNLTCGGDTTPGLMGILTDADFVEGIIEGMKEKLGVQGGQFYLREGNLLGDAYCPDSNSLNGYKPVAQRTGAQLTSFDSGKLLSRARLANLEEGSEVIWREVPGGVVYQRIGYLAPINDEGTFNFNIAKFKAHGMGITLAAKNWQGTNVHPYVHYCSAVNRQFEDSPAASDVNPDYRAQIQALYDRHRSGGVPRWDRPGTIDNWNSGAGMEMWVQKTLDNHAASRPTFHMIEGIYGRNGNGFEKGPGLGGRAEDFMTNLVIFGQNAFKVDIIGHWLAGHEPGNFGLFHSALDRGLNDRLNPREIPVYTWEEGQPVSRTLDELERHALATYYLQRDYGGEKEPLYHMLDQSFDYGPPTAVLEETGSVPQSFLLNQNYPNPFNPSTLIEYRLPREGRVRLEVFNDSGQLVEVLAEGFRPAGAHVAAWDASGRASGVYFYRFWTEGFAQTRKMLLIR